MIVYKVSRILDILYSNFFFITAGIKYKLKKDESRLIQVFQILQNYKFYLLKILSFRKNLYNMKDHSY